MADRALRVGPHRVTSVLMHRRPVLATVTALATVIALGAAVAAVPAIEGFCLSFRAPSDTSEVTLEAAADTLDTRLGAMQIAGDAVADQDAGTIEVQLKPGPQDLAAATDLAASLGATGLLEFMPIPPGLQGVVGEGPLPAGMQDIEPLFTGVEIDSAVIVTDDAFGELVVDVQLNDTGASLFDEFAADHFGEQFAIVLDGQVLSAPFIQSARFGGRAQISGGDGGFSPGEAQALIAVASSGAMPVELSLDEVWACAVPADLSVPTPPARAGEDLEAPAT
jgi:preprotein translocase subunit SecD